MGRGTTCKIYLPRVDGPAASIPVVHIPSSLARGTETVLLAEDEQDVREVAREFLESAGYTVLEAAGGAEPLEVSAAHAGPIDLLITDLVMPGIPGPHLTPKIPALPPAIRVIHSPPPPNNTP